MNELRWHAASARSRLWLVGLAYAMRSAVALALAWPLANTLANDSVMASPRTDRELFSPGARVLLQALAEQSSRLLVWLRHGWLVGSAVVLVSALGATILLSALANPPNTRASIWVAEAVRILPTTVVITVTGWLSFIAVTWLAKLALPAVPAIIYPLFGEKGADAALAVGAFGLALFALFAFTVTDLARATAVASTAGARTALAVAFEAFARHARTCVIASAGYFGASFALPVCVAMLLPATSSSTTSMLVLTALVHQLTVFVSCALHLCWWALTVKIVRASLRPKDSQNDASMD